MVDEPSQCTKARMIILQKMVRGAILLPLLLGIVAGAVDVPDALASMMRSEFTSIVDSGSPWSCRCKSVFTQQ